MSHAFRLKMPHDSFLSAHATISTPRTRACCPAPSLHWPSGCLRPTIKVHAVKTANINCFVSRRRSTRPVLSYPSTLCNAFVFQRPGNLSRNIDAMSRSPIASLGQSSTSGRVESNIALSTTVKNRENICCCIYYEGLATIQVRRSGPCFTAIR